MKIHLFEDDGDICTSEELPTWGKVIEVDQVTWDRWELAFSVYSELQIELQKIYDATPYPPMPEPKPEVPQTGDGMPQAWKDTIDRSNRKP